MEPSDAIPILVEDAEVDPSMFEPVESKIGDLGRVFVYPHPLFKPTHVKEEVDYRCLVDEKGFLRGFDPCEQAMFLEALSEEVGMPLRLSTCKENLVAAHLKGSLYGEKILPKFSVYLRELVVNLGERSFVRMVSMGEMTKDFSFDHLVCNGDIICPIDVSLSIENSGERLGRRYHVGGVVQKGIFTESGDFNYFRDVLPRDTDFEEGSERGSTWKLINSGLVYVPGIYVLSVHKPERVNHLNRLYLQGHLLPHIPYFEKMGVSLFPWTSENPRK